MARCASNKPWTSETPWELNKDKWTLSKGWLRSPLSSPVQPSLYCHITLGFQAKEMLDPYFWYSIMTSLMGSSSSNVQANAYNWLIATLGEKNLVSICFVLFPSLWGWVLWDLCQHIPLGRAACLGVKLGTSWLGSELRKWHSPSGKAFCLRHSH